MATIPQLTVLGLGNELLGDDGLGVWIVRALHAQRLPEHVELIEAGAAGLNLLNLIERAHAILAIDAAEMGAPPGTHRWISPQHLRAPQGPALSLHDASFVETLWLAQQFSRIPPTTIFAVQPAALERRAELSPTLAATLPHLVRIVCDHLWQHPLPHPPALS
jgi:hydrogenase maturation protease